MSGSCGCEIDVRRISLGAEIIRMEHRTIRERLDAYTKEKYGIDPEILPFSHEDYEI